MKDAVEHSRPNEPRFLGLHAPASSLPAHKSYQEHQNLFLASQTLEVDCILETRL